MLHANFTALSSFYRTGVIAGFEVLHCGNRGVRVFCCCNLDLEPMTFMYEFDPYPRPKINFLRQVCQKSPYYRQTDRQTPPALLPPCFTGGNTFMHEHLLSLRAVGRDSSDTHAAVPRWPDQHYSWAQDAARCHL